eukprot:NODE_3311_length_991_cov_26.416667_g3165_i0.p1 GENE.NODE_3311_length_991_cov_26.416667_g3165_i0~~NODE_3311_length_991_cov_26.416667_g3165_i0.p1  ORF type:complete len:306 (+),score=84.39 NODE_3311_length_991_cov_26.416667_g3165_i0:47-919(+)
MWILIFVSCMLADDSLSTLLPQLKNATHAAEEANDTMDTLSEIGLHVNKVLSAAEQEWHNSSKGIGLGAMLVLGSIFLFFGSRMFKATLFIAGFLCTAAITFSLLNDNSTLEMKYVLLTMLCVGLIGGIITICIFKVGMFVVGGFVGFWVATFILSVVITHNGRRVSLLMLLSAPYQYYLSIAAAALCCGALTLTHRFQKLILVLATTLGGSFCICCFIDHWAQTGFSQAIQSILSTAHQQKDWSTVDIRSEAWALLSLCVLLTLIGFAAQYYTKSKPVIRHTEHAESKL